MKLFIPSRRAAVLGTRFSSETTGCVRDDRDGLQTDDVLLHRYARFGSDEAFTEIVHRHAGWVYAVCRRNLRDAHLAEDAAQAVFLLLARKAASLRPQTHLAGWLFQACRYVLADIRRHHTRYQRRQELARDLALHRASDLDRMQSPSDCEAHVALDEAIASLRESDRQAVLMRFYEALTVPQIATRLGITPEAAKKRITRALSRLRKSLGGKTGVSSAAKRSALPLAGLSLLLQSGAAEAAPVGLALSIAKAATVPGLSSALAEMIVAGVRQATLHATSKLLVALAATAAPVAVIVSVTQPPVQQPSPSATALALSSPPAQFTPSNRPASFAAVYNRTPALIPAPTPRLVAALRNGRPLDPSRAIRNTPAPSDFYTTAAASSTVRPATPLPAIASPPPKRLVAPPRPPRFATVSSPAPLSVATKQPSADSSDQEPDPSPSKPRHPSQSPFSEDLAFKPPSGEFAPYPPSQAPDMSWPRIIDLPPSPHRDMFADAQTHPDRLGHSIEHMMLDRLPPAAFLHEERHALLLHWRGPVPGGPELHDLLASSEHDRQAAVGRDDRFAERDPSHCHWLAPGRFDAPPLVGIPHPAKSGSQPFSPTSVPEPSAGAVILSIAGALALRRRRRLSPPVAEWPFVHIGRRYVIAWDSPTEVTDVQATVRNGKEPV